MPTRWLVHAPGLSDLGLAVARDRARAEAARDERCAALAGLPRAELSARLAELRWPGQEPGRSPLAAVFDALPAEPDTALLLVGTAYTRVIGEAFVAALRAHPDLFGPAVAEVRLVLVDGPGGGLSEMDVSAALAGTLPEPGTTVWLSWGSGSTQLSLGVLDALIAAEVDWRLIGIAPGRTARAAVFHPTAPTGLDPMVPLLRRWHYHEALATLLADDDLGTTPEQRAIIATDAARWRRAHERPTPDGLRLLAADALARRDSLTGLTLRAYVLSRYHELRDREPAGTDLAEWAVNDIRGKHPTLGLMRQRIQQSHDSAVRTARARPSGQWWLSTCVKEIIEAGKNSAHELRQITPTKLRALREHLADVTEDEHHGLPAVGGAPADTAWYLRISGLHDDTDRLDLLGTLTDHGVDRPVADYLGLAATAVGLRFLLLGTENTTQPDGTSRPGSAEQAERRAVGLNRHRDGLADWATIPATAGSDWTTETALAVLRARLAPVRAEIGALVVIPTGPKPLLPPLLAAAQQLAAERGIPLFLRQITETGAMHRLPLRFGSHARLLELAERAVGTLELDAAARLLDACAAEQDLAARVRALAERLFDRNQRTAESGPGLLTQRLAVWLDLAREHTDPGQRSRAVLGVCASIARTSRRQADGIGRAGVPADWTKADPVFAAVNKVRNHLPTSHGGALPDRDTLDVLVRDALGRAAPAGVGLLELLGLVVRTVDSRWPDQGRRPTLAAELAAVRREIRDRVTRENDRLDRRHTELGASFLDEQSYP